MGSAMGAFQGNDNTLNRQQLEQAMTEEKKSIGALALFISKCRSCFFFGLVTHQSIQISEHACEVIGLWKILCEHQFPQLFRSLQKEEQDILCCCTFR